MNNHWHKCLANYLNNYLHHIITHELMDKTNLSQTGIARLMLEGECWFGYTHLFVANYNWWKTLGVGGESENEASCQVNFVALWHPPNIVNLSPGHSLLSCVPGVLLPGQQLAFPFTFKSPNTGIFSETWSLHTGPVLGKGRPIFLTLKGITFQEDVNAQRRQEIEVWSVSLFVPLLNLFHERK